MSDFINIKMGDNCLQRELEEAGDDWDTLNRLKDRLHINPTGSYPRTPEDVRLIIQQHIDNTSRLFHEVKRKMKHRSKLMIDTLRKCRQNQLKCQKFYEDSVSEVSQLNKLMTCQLNIYRPKFIEEMKERIARLQKGRLRILILGEICAGKSSILNIWMDGQYFPVGHGHCTRVPCEVRNDTERHAYLYYGGEQWANPSVEFELPTDPKDPLWVRIRECVVNGYDRVPEDEAGLPRPLHKIVISWPLIMLQTQQIQIQQLQTDLKKKQTNDQTSPKATASSARILYQRQQEPQTYSKSEETAVLKPVNENTALKKRNSEPVIKYRGIMVPAIHTKPKSPDIVTVSSPDSDSGHTAGCFSFDENCANDVFDDTLKLINGITFVDAPGIRDTDEDFLNLQPLIQSADAFIFVISTAEHDGVDKDRVMKLMEIVRKTSEKKNNFFNPQCTMFLCNKWDLIADEYKETLNYAILERLRECWPTISSKQLFPISGSKQILLEIQNGIIPQLFEQFYYGVCSFIESAASISVEFNCWWLTSFLDQVVVLQKNATAIQAYAGQQKREVLQRLSNIKRSMLEVNDVRDMSLEKLKEEEEKTKENIQARIRKVLKSNADKICDWTHSSLPEREDNQEWKLYQDDLNKAIVKRIEHLLLNDEETDHIIDLYEEKVKKELYGLKKSVIDEDQKASFLQPLTASIDSPDESFGSLSKAKFPFLVLAVVVTLPVAPLLLIIWHLYEVATVPVLQCDEELFIKDPTEYMRKQTNIFIERILSEKLPDIANVRLEALSRNAYHMMHFFYTCIENRLKSIEEMYKQIEGEVVTKDRHTKLRDTITELSRFYIQEVMKHEIHFDSLRTDTENPAKIIGAGGQCSYVVKGEYFDEKSNEVAVKVIKWPRGEEESIFRECFLLRQLSQKPEHEKTNFVKFFGSTYEISGYTFKLMLVCELCDIDLAKIVQMDKLIQSSGNELEFPGKDPMKGRGWNYFFVLAKQTACGLQFVHNNGIVHRDVKPCNFLVKFAGQVPVVKIADVGLSRNVDLIATTRIGTKLYSAPEVQLGSLHTFSSDVYSLCLVLYELWYGQLIPANIPDRPPLNFYLQPPRLKDTKPPHILQDLITSAWAYIPAQRPRIRDIVQCLDTLSNKYRY